MKEYTITATSTQGEIALQQHTAESRKIGYLNKKALKIMGISHEVSSTKPYTISIRITSALAARIKDGHIINEIKEALSENNAKSGKDYIISVTER